jgi:hypothetical protein
MGGLDIRCPCAQLFSTCLLGEMDRLVKVETRHETKNRNLSVVIDEKTGMVNKALIVI